MNENRYFIYARKSTDDPKRQVRSIGDQIAELRDLAQRENVSVIDVLTEKESAKMPGRPVFNAMLERIAKGEAKGILAWHPDRLARNSLDGGQIIYALDTGVIADLRFCTFKFENTPSGKFMLSILFGHSKYYVDSLGENVKRGQRHKLLNGIWPTKAPLGYRNDKVTRTIVPDPIRGPLVRKAFEIYASGEHTLDEVTAKLNDLGFTNRSAGPLFRSQCHRMLKNPIYCGIILFNGERYEGSHEPLITKRLYDQVQVVITRKSKPRTPKFKPYLYRGVFRCVNCGCMITTETQKGHNYLRCTKRVKRDCPNPYVREEEIGKQITAAIASVALPDTWTDWLLEQLQAERRSDNVTLSGARERVASEIRAVDDKMSRLTDAYMGQALTLDEYKPLRTKLLSDKQELKDQMSALEATSTPWFEPATRFVNEVKRARFLTENGSDSEKRDFFKRTGSNLRVLNRELRWEPRQAWQIVQNHGRFAHKHTTAPVPGAAVVRGELVHDFHEPLTQLGIKDSNLD